MLHIYRNTPFGRETLLQSIYFSKLLDLKLHIYIPTQKKFLMYFEHEAVQIDLDSSYLKDTNNARANLQGILSEMNTIAFFLEPKDYTASNLPDISSNFSFMCCPRSISDLSSKISLGHIGSKVRKILLAASFPVLVPSQVFKKWKSVTVMFGGSLNGIKSLQLGLKIAQLSNMPLDIVTQSQSQDQDVFEEILHQRGLLKEVRSHVREWFFFKQRDFSANLFSVPHNSIIIMGLFGHGLVKDIFFGSTMELVQSTLPNTLLLVGPHFQKHRLYYG